MAESISNEEDLEHTNEVYKTISNIMLREFEGNPYGLLKVGMVCVKILACAIKSTEMTPKMMDAFLKDITNNIVICVDALGEGDTDQ